MPALQVRDFPPELYEKLRESAARDHRSIAQQTIVAVNAYLDDDAMRREGERDATDAQTSQPANAAEQTAGTLARYTTPPTVFSPQRDTETPEERIERRKHLFERIHAMPKFEVPAGFPSTVEIIREARDAR